MENITNVMGALKVMNPGDVLAFPIRRIGSVKAIATMLNTQMPERQYSTVVDRKEGTISVIRRA